MPPMPPPFLGASATAASVVIRIEATEAATPRPSLPSSASGEGSDGE
jgi:hypothetical protein